MDAQCRDMAVQPQAWLHGPRVRGGCARELESARSAAGPSSLGRARSRTVVRWSIPRCAAAPLLRALPAAAATTAASSSLSLLFSLPPKLSPSCFSLVSRLPPHAGATLAAKTVGCCMLLQVSSAVTAHRPPPPPPPSARPRPPTATRQPQRCYLTQPSAFRSISLFSIFRPPALSCLPLSLC